ncbi:hypothetical protein [Anaerotignum sp.]|uniref:hypothetical protein n=1 Tax=Anaerotignum sp. TaxID=2039241 RepID=UPI002715435E|nr:hypothetical protein [Anaerotignum sp.]
MQLNKKIGVKYPTKTDINLAVREGRTINKKTVLFVGIFLMVCMAAFSKLAIFDLLQSVDNAEKNMQQAQTQLDRLKQENLIYDDVLKEYNESVSLSLSSSVIATISERLDIVDQYLIGNAKVESYNILDDVITARISGITLNQVSDIYTALMANDLISNVQIYTASTKDESDSLTTATMTIVLAVNETQEEGGGEQS